MSHLHKSTQTTKSTKLKHTLFCWKWYRRFWSRSVDTIIMQTYIFKTLNVIIYCIKHPSTMKLHLGNLSPHLQFLKLWRQLLLKAHTTSAELASQHAKPPAKPLHCRGTKCCAPRQKSGNKNTSAHYSKLWYWYKYIICSRCSMYMALTCLQLFPASDVINIPRLVEDSSVPIFPENKYE